MSEQINAICLEVFTDIYASTSHELKNCLAIINENAGLLDDYCALVGDGGLGTEHVIKGTTGIKKQVRRADKIIKRMNTLSHSTDNPASAIPLVEMVQLCVDLSHRKAASARIDVEVTGNLDTQIHGWEPAVESLLYLVLVELYQTHGEGELQIEVTEENETALIRFFTKAHGEDLCKASEKMALLCTDLQATLTSDEQAVHLSFPAVK